MVVWPPRCYPVDVTASQHGFVMLVAMPVRLTHLSEHTDGALSHALRALRQESELREDFPAEVLEEAAQATAPTPERDLTEIPFVTLDPAGSRDLDQAMHLERRGSGFVVRYAIADVPGFVTPDGAIDREARLRGQTFYLPDGNIPLHPRILSEDRVSLLPGKIRTAYVWEMTLDSSGECTGTHLERALVKSRHAYDYVDVDRRIRLGDIPDGLALLETIGRLRIEQEEARGGASLTMPDEEIVKTAEGYDIRLRHPLDVEEWNAQLSLLTGMTAGRVMIKAGVGILRTMPAPTADALQEFQERVRLLGAPWQRDTSYGEYLRRLDRSAPFAPAVLQAATSLFRGAGYTVLGKDSQSSETDAETEPAPVRQTALLHQAALASPYAHVTAPLRRLVDRWGLIVSEALIAGREVPEWALESLHELPSLMQSSNSRASRVRNAALDRVEAALLTDYLGKKRDAIVLDTTSTRARIQLTSPPVTAHLAAPEIHPGEHIQVRVDGAHIDSGEVTLSLT